MTRMLLSVAELDEIEARLKGTKEAPWIVSKQDANEYHECFIDSRQEGHVGLTTYGEAAKKRGVCSTLGTRGYANPPPNPPPSAPSAMIRLTHSRKVKMKTKASERIRLSNGTILTLGEALDAGVLVLKEERYYDPPRYFARERGGDLFWEVGKTLYLSRTGQTLPFGRR